MVQLFLSKDALKGHRKVQDNCQALCWSDLGMTLQCEGTFKLHLPCLFFGTKHHATSGTDLNRFFEASDHQNPALLLSHAHVHTHTPQSQLRDCLSLGPTPHNQQSTLIRMKLPDCSQGRLMCQLHLVFSDFSSVVGHFPKQSFPMIAAVLGLQMSEQFCVF